ncbi:MAG TPA: YdcF family protein [Caulobacteraceae bacterium]|nr:YdcF family protein [Caulobacteraceae bacterium]
MKGLAILLLALTVWAAGLFAFAGRVARLTPPADPPPADGIVVLTGASDQRLVAAADLLEEGKGRRLLVSGVNRKARRGDLLGLTGAPRPMFDCCVDLGFSAADTIGNARETARWARALGFRTLILVTADYHMPRAMLELRSAMPGETITPYPVATDALDARHWASSSKSARRMIVEYAKYVVILAREAVLKAGRG